LFGDIPYQPEATRSERLLKANKAQFGCFLRTGLKVLDAALALVALESPKLPNAVLPQALLSPAENASPSCLGIKIVCRRVMVRADWA
jgi:hypothetical protein